MIDANGKGAVRPVTRWSSEQIFPTWSRDGRSLYVRSNRTGEWEIWKLRADGSSPVQLTHGGAYQARENGDGSAVYIDPGPGGAAFLRVPTDRTQVSTSAIDASNRAFVLPQLQFLRDVPWTVDDGILYCKALKSGVVEVAWLDERDYAKHLLFEFAQEKEIRSLTVGPHKQWIVYATNTVRTAALGSVHILSHFHSWPVLRKVVGLR